VPAAERSAGTGITGATLLVRSGRFVALAGVRVCAVNDETGTETCVWSSSRRPRGTFGFANLLPGAYTVTGLRPSYGCGPVAAVVPAEGTAFVPLFCTAQRRPRPDR
jgi:hypothetical protein